MKNQLGLTLIEVILVVIILGVLILLALPGFSSYISHARLRADSWQVASDLREYHLKAIVEHYKYSFNFYVIDNRYIIEKRTHPGDDFIEYALSVKKEEWRDLECNLESATTPITFHPLGYADPAGTSTIILKDDRGDTSTIIVSATTGHVKVE